MKRLTVIALGLLLTGFGLSACAPMTGASGGWTTLINGADGLDNFTRLGDANWRAADGAIVADKGATSYLISKNSYKDFQIRAEFWADHTTNSGIFMRMSDRATISARNSYEVNIFDQRPDPTYGTGAIVDFAAVGPMPKAGGKWNTFDITAKGAQLIVLFNGVQTVNVTNAAFAQGPFSLQFANGANNVPGGAIKWRKLQISEL